MLLIGETASVKGTRIIFMVFEQTTPTVANYENLGTINQDVKITMAYCPTGCLSQKVTFLNCWNPVRGRASRLAIVPCKPGVPVPVEGKSNEPPKIILFSKFVGR